MVNPKTGLDFQTFNMVTRGGVFHKKIVGSRSRDAYGVKPRRAGSGRTPWVERGK